MIDDNKISLEDKLKEISRKEGLSEEQVRAMIAYAVAQSFKDSNPNQQYFWKAIPCEGSAPTLDEIIDYLILHIDIEK